MHLLFLPPYSPELQPAEHLWPLTNSAVMNRHFATIDERDEAQLACCAALQHHTERIRSATLFPPGGRVASSDDKDPETSA